MNIRNISCFFLLSLFCVSFTAAQRTTKPRIIVGVVVDQMRYDYVYKYWDKYSNDGFKRLLRDGFSYEDMEYNYAPTVTGPGHAAVYTGAPPAVSGLANNEWYDRTLKRMVYVCDDSTVQKVGAPGDNGKISPRKLIVTTVTDELKLFSNRRAKVIGVSLKDRASILPAGHLADAAYWFDSPSGAFVTSTFYLNQLPQWVQDFNARKQPDAYLSKTWTPLLPVDQYAESAPDASPFERPYAGAGAQPIFPYDLPKIRGASTGYDLLTQTPYGNAIVTDFAIAAMDNENMGSRANMTDFLAMSYSSTDIIGHQFGPDAVEIEDVYLRLDLEIKKLLEYLDKKYGKDNALLFLTADHAAAHNPGYLQSLKAPAGYFDSKTLRDSLKGFYKRQFGRSDLLEFYEGLQVYINAAKVADAQLSMTDVAKATAQYLRRFAGVQEVYTAEDLRNGNSVNPFFGKMQLGYAPGRSGDVFILIQSGWLDAPAGSKGTSHGTVYHYDAHVPMLWYGWKIKPGKSYESVHITDIAPTVSAILQIMAPSGSIGHVLTEIVPK